MRTVVPLGSVLTCDIIHQGFDNRQSPSAVVVAPLTPAPAVAHLGLELAGADAWR